MEKGEVRDRNGNAVGDEVDWQLKVDGEEVTVKRGSRQRK